MTDGVDLHGASRASRAEVEQRLTEITSAPDTDLQALGDELFAVVALLYAEIGVRRTLVDTTRSVDMRTGLAGALFGERVSAATLRLLETAVAQRWTRGSDLLGTLERSAVYATLDAAERAGVAEDVEDELFRFARIVDGTPQVRNALSDASAPVASRRALATNLLENATAATRKLVEEAVAQAGARTVEATIESYARMAADRRRQLVAHVVSAVPLSDEQRTRLAAALTRQYGSEIHLDLQVDPRVAGGVKVQIGDEVIDGTIDSRMADARRRLAG